MYELSAFLPALVGIVFALVGGIALGTYAGAQTRPLVRGTAWSVTSGLGALVGLVATIGGVALVLAVFGLRVPYFLPVGWLAAGLLFGVVVALVTVDWAGVFLAGGLLTTLLVSGVGGAFLSVHLVQLFRFLPPFLVRLILPYLAPVLAALTSLLPLAILCIVAFLAALAARVVNEMLGRSDSNFTPSSGPATIPVE